MQSKSSRIAVIDIGTNTCLLLIAELVDGRFVKIYDGIEMPRLGHGVDKNKLVSRDSMDRVGKVLKAYVKRANKSSVDRIFSFGTSVLRDAKNSKEVIEYFRSKTDLDVNIFSGEEEAKFGFYGAVFDMHGDKEYSVLDIGGGSTEYSFLQESKFECISMDIGAVRVKEKFFNQGYDAKKVAMAIESINEDFNAIIFPEARGKSLVGVAGTVTSAAALGKGLKNFEEDKIHKTVLSRGQIEGILDILLGTPEDKIRAVGNYMEGRHDIIIPGLIILNEFMKHSGFDEIIVSTKGLRYGVFLYLTKN